MKTGGELSGLAVVTEGTGDRLGRVQDVLFDPGSGRITAFLVHPGGLFAKPQVLPRLFMRRLGSDALLVEPGKVLEDAATDPAVEGSQHGRALDGRPVLDDAGKFLGRVDDVLVDEENLAVPALLLGTNLIDTMLHGKPRIPLAAVKAFGQDSIVVPASYDVASAERSR